MLVAVEIGRLAEAKFSSSACVRRLGPVLVIASTVIVFNANPRPALDEEVIALAEFNGRPKLYWIFVINNDVRFSIIPRIVESHSLGCLKVSRHRGIVAEPNTPEHYWEVRMADRDEQRRRGQIAESESPIGLKTRHAHYNADINIKRQLFR